jgi:periplasmic protein TonB
MNSRISRKLLILSSSLSLLFHALLFIFFQFSYNLSSASPRNTTIKLINASLAYRQPVPAPHPIQKKEEILKKEQGDETIPEKNLTMKKADMPPEQPDVSHGKEPDPALSEAEAVKRVSRGKQVFPREQETTTHNTNEEGKENNQSIIKNRDKEAAEKELVLSGLKEKIARHTTYPAAARRRGMEGTVILVIILDSGGNLKDCQVRESSGHRILDKAAVEMVKRILPYPHTAGTSLEITLPVVYRLL